MQVLRDLKRFGLPIRLACLAAAASVLPMLVCSVVMLVVVCVVPAGPALAATIEVAPTGTSADIHNVKAAIDSAQPGDVILLKAGTFDWSGNSVALPPFVIAFGLPINVSNITITGESGPNAELLTTIVGPVDSAGLPAIYAGSATNAAFVNGPGVSGVTIRNLILRSFETAFHLLQMPAGSLDDIAPGTDFSLGADDFVMEWLRIENSKQGVAGLGANDRLIIRNSHFQIIRIDGEMLGNQFIGGAFGIGYISGRAFNRAVPTDVVFESNTLVGPGPDLTFLVRPNGSTIGFGTSGISAEGALGLRVEGNHVEGFATCIQFGVEGAVRVVGNVARGCQLGIWVADFTPNDAFSATHDALIRNNQAVENVFRAPRADGGSQNPVVSGSGMAVSADNNHFVGNNLENNEVAGMALIGDANTAPNRTPTGNLILGNKNVVVGSQFVLANNTISGSQKSIMNVGQAVIELLDEGRPPFFPH